MDRSGEEGFGVNRYIIISLRRLVLVYAGAAVVAALLAVAIEMMFR
jgi:hypothetical protein